MTISIVCHKLLSTNAHLGRRVAANHFKVYICGSRNGIAILDSDKTLICLRNAFHFIGSPIRQKGRSFFFKTQNLFRSEIMEEMASCINDSQWRIGAFLTHSCSSPKPRKKKINDGSNQQYQCLVLLDADIKSSVILEADRSQIPIASLVDSTIPFLSYQRITYPIPANAPIKFLYLFRHSITKTVILERGRIVAMKEKVVQMESKTHRSTFSNSEVPLLPFESDRVMTKGFLMSKAVILTTKDPQLKVSSKGYARTGLDRLSLPVPVEDWEGGGIF